jgi:hypothetical protein
MTIRALIFLLALPLAACWGGAVFYSASDARPALPPGVYRTLPSSEPDQAETVRVSIRADGMTRIVGKGDEIVGFAPLGGPYFAMWSVEREDGNSAIYALFEAKQGHYRLIIPFCERTTAIAAAAGARIVKDPKTTLCTFETRAQLEDGLRHLEGQTQDLVDFLPVAANSLPPSRSPARHKKRAS